MLYWAMVFLVIALAAATLGFGIAVAGGAVIAKVVFFVFMALFLVAVVAGMARAARPVGRV